MKGRRDSESELFEVREELALDLSMDQSPRVRREEKITANAGLWADWRMKECGNSLPSASLFLVKYGAGRVVSVEEKKVEMWVYYKEFQRCLLGFVNGF